MRDQDGWWFLRELRALRNANAKVPVFALSADHNQEQAAVLGGFHAFFLKPVNLDALVAHLAALPRQRDDRSVASPRSGVPQNRLSPTDKR
jgi:DNA-binding response OmpR family regulator